MIERCNLLPNFEPLKTLLFILCKSGPELNAKITTKTKFEIRPVQPKSVIVKEQDGGKMKMFQP
jgi:hypothetical protein